ncbi:hypothetical protein L1887_03074 [Cichorium endivia]|nr:hypothetical protein L1887_03074 [Cichorium endivia]
MRDVPRRVDEEAVGVNVRHAPTPFPSPINSNIGNPIDPFDQCFAIGGFVGKRRRLTKEASRVPSPTFDNPPIAMNLEKSLFSSHVVVSSSVVPNRPLLTANDDSNSDSTNSDRNMTSKEIRKNCGNREENWHRNR